MSTSSRGSAHPGARDDYAASGVATALNYVSMDDVRPASEVDFAAEPLASSEFRCKDGLVVTLETSKFDGKTWARVLVHAERRLSP